MKKIYILLSSLTCAILTLCVATTNVFAAELGVTSDGETVSAIETGDITAPIIMGTSNYSVTNKSKVNVESYINNLTIVDDSDVTYSITSDSYSENWQAPGEYGVTINFVDSNSNSTDFTITIVVNDVISPVFYNFASEVSTKTTIIKAQNAILTLNDIMNKLTCYDVGDGVINSFEVVSDTYTGNGDTKGTYYIVFKATDKAGNSTEHNVEVKVTDISNMIIYNNSRIIIPANIKLEKDDFITMLSTCGYYNDKTTTYITVNSTSYDNSFDCVGVYDVACEIVTTSGTNKTVNLTVEVVEAIDYDYSQGQTSAVVKVFKWIGSLFTTFFEWIGSLINKAL